MHNKTAAAAMLALCLVVSAPAAEASFWGDIAGSILSGISKQTQQSHKETAESTKSTGSMDSRTAARHKRYAAAMKELENINWVGVAKSSGDKIYFDEDTLEVAGSAKGDRAVKAWMKDIFTESGTKAVIEASKGKLSQSDNVSYSLYEVEYGEKGCRLSSGVAYFDKDGKKLLTLPASEALPDVTTAGFSADYTFYKKGSVQENAKEKIFERAFPEDDAASAQNTAG